MSPELSVVLPCYNESGNLSSILERYRPLAAKADLELILVDNGSTDGSDEVLKELLAQGENRFARSVRVEKNIGYGHGLQTGLEASKGGIAAISHADLQTPPEDVLTALGIYKKRVKDGDCLVKGRRCGRRPILDECVTGVYNRLAARLLGFEASPVTAEGEPAGETRFADVNAEPKLFRRKLIADLAAGTKDFTYDLFALHCARQRGLRVYEFDVGYESRAWGKSKLAANPWVRLKTSLNAFKKIFEMRGGKYVLP